MSNQSMQSSILPAGKNFEPIRNGQPHLSSMTIEIGHILCFFVIAYFIFGRSLLKSLQAKTSKKVVKPVQQPGPQILVDKTAI